MLAESEFTRLHSAGGGAQSSAKVRLFGVALRQEDVSPEVIPPTDKKRRADLIKFHLVVSFVLCSC